MKKLAVLSLMVLIAACSDSVTSPDPVKISPVGAEAGIYTLSSYNGHAIPAVTAVNNSGEFGVWGGKLVLSTDHTYTRTVDWGNEGDTKSQVEKGSFSLSGSTIMFRPSNLNYLNGYVGQLSGRTISYGAGIPNATYAFTR